VGDVQPCERWGPRSCWSGVSAREDNNWKLPSGLRLSGLERRVGGDESGPQLGAATRVSGLRVSVSEVSTELNLDFRIGLEVQPPCRWAGRAATRGHND
jgi:hypothetical protein